MSETQTTRGGSEPRGHLARSASAVMFGNVLCLGASLASQLLIAAIFGAGADMDAFLTAAVIPVYVQAVLLAGLTFVFIPAFVRHEESGNDDDAWALAGTVTWLAVGSFTLLALVGAILAPGIVSLTAPGLHPAKSQLVSAMLRVMMFTLPFAAVADLATGIQNARGRFFWPAAAPAVGTLANVGLLWLSYTVLGPMALAWGALVSFAVQAALVLWPILRHGWKRTLPLRDPRLVELAKLAWPLVLFGVLTRITPVFERYFASTLPDGHLSYLGYASKVSNLVASLVGAGIASAILPEMARQYASRGRDGLAQTVDYGFRFSLAVALPLLVILSVVRVPLVHALFERGAFTHETTIMVSAAVPWVLAVVVAQMLTNVIGRSFYVVGDTITVPATASVTAVLYLMMAALFSRQGWGYLGLASAQTIQMALLVAILLVVMVKRGSLTVKGFIRRLAQYVAPAIGGGLVTYVVSHAVSQSSALVGLVLSLAAGAIAYLIVLSLIDWNITMDLFRLAGVGHLRWPKFVRRLLIAD